MQPLRTQILLGMGKEGGGPISGTRSKLLPSGQTGLPQSDAKWSHHIGSGQAICSIYKIRPCPCRSFAHLVQHRLHHPPQTFYRKDNRDQLHLHQYRRRYRQRRCHQTRNGEQLSKHRRARAQYEDRESQGFSSNRLGKFHQVFLENSTIIRYYRLMKRRYQKTLGLLFSRPASANIKWRDIEALFTALGAELIE